MYIIIIYLPINSIARECEYIFIDVIMMSVY